jgi:crotonobetaine/carnitine-CoA ligase
MHVPGILARQAQHYGDRPLVHFGDETMTFASAYEGARRAAGELTALGVKQGDFVGLFLPNSLAFLDLYFGLCELGAVMVPVNTAYRGYMLEYLLNDTGCTVLLVHPDLLHEVVASESLLDHLQTVVVGGLSPDQAAEWRPRFKRLDLRRAEEIERVTPPDVAITQNDINCVIYTSGTTGPSKGVLITNGHAIAKALEVIEICDIVESDVIYSPLPLFHSMALLRGVLAGLVSGSSVVLRDRFSASVFWQEAREFGVTVAHCVFSIPKILEKSEPSPDDRNHKVRLMYNATYDAAFEARFGVRLIEGYGLTEAGVSMFMRADAPPRPGSCGRLSEDWEVRLVDENEQPVPVGEIGEILMRPRHPHRMTPGYLNKADVTVQQFRNLWLHTGDLATVDEEGFYYFKDRKKDAIRRRGENVSSWELERILVSHPGVEDAAAVPYPSELGEEEIRIVVTRFEDVDVAMDDLVAYCEQRMPDFMVPRYFEIRDELPRTPTGRVEKYRLREEGLGPGAFDRGDRRPVRKVR